MEEAIRKPRIGGRPRKEFSDEIKTIFFSLVEMGMADQRAAKVIGICKATLHIVANRDPEFRRQWDAARAKRKTMLVKVVTHTMVKQIKRGSSWWLRFAIKNFHLGFRDPDVGDQHELEALKVALRAVVKTSGQSTQATLSIAGENKQQSA